MPKKSATAGRFSGFARRLSGFWLNFHSNRGKIYMWNRLLFGSRLHGGFIRDSGQPVGTDLYIAVAWQFYTDLSRLPCRDPPPRNRRRVLYRNFKIQAIQGCFSDFSSPPYPHARSRYTIPRSDQCKKVPFCACGRRRKARYESVHTPCKTFGLFGQPSEILDRVSCIFFVYLFHTE